MRGVLLTAFVWDFYSLQKIKELKKKISALIFDFFYGIIINVMCNAFEIKRQVVVIKNNVDFLKPDVGRVLAEDAIIHTYECIGQIFNEQTAKEECASNEYIELGIVTQGVGVHYVDGNTVPCKTGDLYIVPPGVSHAYFSYANSEKLIVRKLIFLVQDWFHGEVALRTSKRYCYGVFSDGGAVAYAMLNARMNEKISGIMDDVESELSDKEEGWKNVVFAYLIQTFSFLGRYSNRSLKNSFKKSCKISKVF